MTVCQCILLPLFVHQQNNDIVCQGILFPLSMHQQNYDIVCQGILFPLSMHQQNNDIVCQGILLPLSASTEQIVIADVCHFNVLICLFNWTFALAQTFMYKPK